MNIIVFQKKKQHILRWFQYVLVMVYAYVYGGFTPIIMKV